MHHLTGRTSLTPGRPPPMPRVDGAPAPTIIVSPTARPKPIMIAEKIPGLAVGRMTRVTVCQRLAPRASDPARRFLGTLEKASSAMEKMIGITANPIASPTTIAFL